MKARLKKSVVIVATLMTTCAAQAGVVYENGSLAGVNGGNNPFSVSNRYVAMDFTLTGATSLDSVTFNAWTKQGTLPITNVGVHIYSNNAANVGGELYSGNFGLSGQQTTGSLSGYTLVDYTVALSDWNLGTGTYWIGLQADPAQWDMHWSIVNPIGYGGKIGDAVGSASSYTNYGFEHYFELTGHDQSNNVPEPGTLALLGLGLSGILLGRRRQPK